MWERKAGETTNFNYFVSVSFSYSVSFFWFCVEFVRFGGMPGFPFVLVFSKIF